VRAGFFLIGTKRTDERHRREGERRRVQANKCGLKAKYVSGRAEAAIYVF